MEKLSQRPGYRWVVVGCCFTMIFVCLGFCSSTKTLYLEPVTTALDLPRSLYSITETLRYIFNSLITLAFGALMLRFGARKLIAAGFVCLTGAMLCYAFANGLPLIYLGGALLGIGQSWTSTSMVGYVVGRWCRKNKGTIMGAVMAANGVGGAVATQIIDPIIKSPSFGFRGAYLITAIILVVVALAVVLPFRNAPETLSVAPAQAKKRATNTWYGLTRREAVRQPYFYAACFYMFIMGMVIQSIAGVQKAVMTGVGIRDGFATLVISIYSLALTGTKFLTGFVYDRLGARVTFLITTLCATLAPFLMAMLGGSSQVLAMASAVIFTVGVPLQTIGMPLMTTELFGVADDARMLGTMISVSTIGYAVGPPIVNLFYDIQKSYKIPLMLLGVLMALATVAIFWALSKAQKIRKQTSMEA